METPEYTSSCAITQKIKPANVRVVKISQCTPIPKIQLGSIKFWIWPRAYSQPQALLSNDIQTVGPFWLESLMLCLFSLMPYWRYVQFTLWCAKLLIPALVFYLFTVALSYQAFNYLIILHWAQLKHNRLCCCKSQLFLPLQSIIQSTGEICCCSWPSIMYLE